MLIVACLVPVIYSFKPSTEFPKIPIHFENSTSKITTISKWGTFYLSVTDSPFSEFQIGSGRLALEIEKEFVSIPPDSTIIVFGKFINGKRFMPALIDGDKNLRVSFYRDTSYIVQQSGIIFNEDNIRNHYCLIKITE